MYLQHFGLSEPPFKITPVTDFFFNGANRKEILDALIYSISEVEGIIKVSGEVGSGKTMLCRMLLEKLPAHIEPVYLANPSLSREEMLYAIADALDLNIDSERVGVIMQRIQGKLEEKANANKRVVVLVDEAHAMPTDTLEELRLLYNLQAGNAKLLQIVLFGQPELNAKLEQPNMRQLKDRIVHHFIMQPVARDTLENYLMFRMRTAGYHGPNIFSTAAIKLIAKTSNGLMRRANVLADKSLLAAFVEGVHLVEARHVQAAIRDSELNPIHVLPHKKLLLGSATAALLLAASVGWWFFDKAQQSASAAPARIAPVAAPIQTPVAIAPVAPVAPVAVTQPTVTSQPAQPDQKVSEDDAKSVNLSLFEQRLNAGKQLLIQRQTAASLQLYYTKEIQPERMEGFLERADGLGKLTEIYLLPARFGKKRGLRVLYGAYPSVEAARNAIKDLPQRYQDAFATTIYIF